MTLDPVDRHRPDDRPVRHHLPGVTSWLPAPQETCTATYTTTQADVNAGQIVNTGTATGTPPPGIRTSATRTLRRCRALQTPNVTIC